MNIITFNPKSPTAEEIEFFAINYLSSQKWDLNVISSYDNGTSENKYSASVVFTTPFKLPSVVTSYNFLVEDTTSNRSFQSLNKPYAVAGRIVAMYFDTVPSGFTSDCGDYVTFDFSTYVNGSAIDSCFIVLSTLNSTLTDAYTPLGSCNATHIVFLDLQEVMNSVSVAQVPDAIINNAANNGTLPVLANNFNSFINTDGFARVPKPVRNPVNPVPITFNPFG